MIVREELKGSLVVDGDKVAIRLGAADSLDVVYLSYALVTQGPAYRIIPSVLLDDWGNEIGGLQLYRWINENGLKFPRAEVFGIDPSGDQVQFFLRDLELFAKHSVYAYADREAPVGSGIEVQAVLVADDLAISPENISALTETSPLLGQAQVTWWRVNPRQDTLEFLK